MVHNSPFDLERYCFEFGFEFSAFFTLIGPGFIFDGILKASFMKKTVCLPTFQKSVKMFDNFGIYNLCFACESPGDCFSKNKKLTSNV